MQLFDCHLLLKSLDTADHVGHVPAKLGFVVDKIQKEWNLEHNSPELQEELAY